MCELYNVNCGMPYNLRSAFHMASHWFSLIARGPVKAGTMHKHGCVTEKEPDAQHVAARAYSFVYSRAKRTHRSSDPQPCVLATAPHPCLLHRVR